MLTDGLQPTTMRLSPATTTTTLRPGQIFQTTVSGTPDQLSLNLNGTRLPLDAEAGLVAGQRVQAEILSAQQGLHLRLTPLPTETTSATPSKSSALALLTSVLQTLNAMYATDNAQSLLSQKLPQTATAIQQLLALFVNRDTLNRDLQSLLSILVKAAQHGAIDNKLVETLSIWLSQFTATESKAFNKLLRKLHSEGKFEARLAAALRAGDLDAALATIHADLQAQIAQLQTKEGFLTYLRESKQAGAFDQLIDRIFARWTGANFQNLRQLDLPYLYLEIPLPPDGNILHAQVHLLGEGQRGNETLNKKNATIVLDLATAHLGDLWISIRIAQGRCQCHFQAINKSVVNLIHSSSQDLNAAMARVGYTNTTISAAPWDGDRIKATADLMRRSEGLNLHA